MTSGDDAAATGAVGAHPIERIVAFPLGRVHVAVDRRGLALGARGGFDARWASGDAPPDPRDASALPERDREAFRLEVRAHLRAVARLETGRSPTRPSLNLAAHQLVDDVEGWTRLNAAAR